VGCVVVYEVRWQQTQTYFPFRQKCLIVIIGNHHPSSQMSHFYFGTLPFWLRIRNTFTLSLLKAQFNLFCVKLVFVVWDKLFVASFSKLTLIGATFTYLLFVVYRSCCQFKTKSQWKSSKFLWLICKIFESSNVQSLLLRKIRQHSSAFIIVWQ
jgi:hypothetical protein